jgi:hypothetical protein
LYKLAALKDGIAAATAGRPTSGVAARMRLADTAPKSFDMFVTAEPTPGFAFANSVKDFSKPSLSAFQPKSQDYLCRTHQT